MIPTTKSDYNEKERRRQLFFSHMPTMPGEMKHRRKPMVYFMRRLKETLRAYYITAAQIRDAE